MENASKALIIAGSILLSILIIALGMYIFSQSNGAADDTTLSSMETQTFNGKFNKYEGRQNGSNVDALLTVITNNLNGKTQIGEIPNVQFQNNGVDTPENIVAVDGLADIDNVAVNGADGFKNALKGVKRDLESSHVYFVYMATNNDTDLIHGIIISYDQLDEGVDQAEALANP